MTIPKECKRLAEVDFPIAVVSKHAAREKSIRHGHPSTLHLWWARRPLASGRAMLMACCCLTRRTRIARRVQVTRPHFVDDARPPARLGRNCSDDRGCARACSSSSAIRRLGQSGGRYLPGTARALVKAAHPDETPLVVDPFSGGGSIPLEALRVGCDASPPT